MFWRKTYRKIKYWIGFNINVSEIEPGVLVTKVSDGRVLE